MRILKELMIVTLVFSMFVFTGCQGNNSEEVGNPTNTGTAPDISNASVTVVMNVTSSEVTINNAIVTIDVKAIDSANRPYTDGSIEIIYPDSVRTGRDVGYFSANSIALDSLGIATFTYTAPDDLSSDTSDIQFSFYHDSDAANTVLYTINLNPAVNQIVPTDYNLEINPSDGKNTMDLESSKTFVTRVTDKDGNDIPEGNYTIENLNPLLGTIYDSSGVAIASTDVIISENVNFKVETGKTSGTMPIKVNVSFVDVNGDTQVIEKVFNITIFSGPPTAMSISYVSTGQDAPHAQFIEEFSVKLTDKYNNNVNTQPMIQVGGIAGYTKDKTVYPAIKAAADATRDGTPTPIPASGSFVNSGLYNGNLIALRTDADISNYSASLSKIKIGNSMNYDISDFDLYNNIIVTFGDGYRYQKSGKWDIESVDTTTDEFLLNDKYDKASDGFDMGFAIGNNFRQDTCVYGKEWVLTTESSDGTYQVDSSGYAKVKMSYDYYLAGKDIIVYANLIADVLGSTDETLRVGEAVKATLRGHGLTPVPSTGYTIPAGMALTAGFIFEWKLKDTPEWHKNGHAGGYAINVTGEGVSCSATAFNDYRNCENEGVAYVSLSCTGGTKDGTVTLSDGVVATELAY